MTGTRAGSMLIIWNGITAEGEAEYYRWHDSEHIPERLSVPGFFRGRRFAHTDRVREYLTVYETASVETLGSRPYLSQLAQPTPWSERVNSRHFRDMARMVFRVVATTGRGEGGLVLATRLDAAAALGWAGPSLGKLAEAPAVVAAHVLEHDPDATRRIRGQADDGRPWLLLVEAGDAVLAARAVEEAVPAARARPPRIDAYRLQISVRAG